MLFLTCAPTILWLCHLPKAHTQFVCLSTLNFKYIQTFINILAIISEARITWWFTFSGFREERFSFFLSLCSPKWKILVPLSRMLRKLPGSREPASCFLGSCARSIQYVTYWSPDEQNPANDLVIHTPRAKKQKQQTKKSLQANMFTIKSTQQVWILRAA